MCLRQVGLHHHLGLARIGHIDGGEILRRALVREPDDASPIGRDLHRHAFTHAAEAAELVLGEQLEIPAHRFVLCGQRAFLSHRHVVLLGIFRAQLLARWRNDEKASASRRSDTA